MLDEVKRQSVIKVAKEFEAAGEALRYEGEAPSHLVDSAAAERAPRSHGAEGA